MSRRRTAGRALVSVWLALFLVALAPARAAAWGGKGHAVVAHIAQYLLTERARVVSSELLAGDQTESETLDSVASWADALRGRYADPGPRPETANWHFVDIPRDQTYNPERDCDFLLNGPCVIEAILGTEKVLAFPRSGYYQNSRYEALKYVVHLVGDIHQPLHCINDNDTGGNGKKVRWVDGQTWKLHGVWDDAILSRNIAKAKSADPNFSQTGDDAADYANYIIRHLTAAQKQAARNAAAPQSQNAAIVNRSEIVAWARESNEIANRAYDNLPSPGSGGIYDLSDSGTNGYYAKHSDDVRKQLLSAGVRLARILNETLK